MAAATNFLARGGGATITIRTRRIHPIRPMVHAAGRRVAHRRRTLRARRRRSHPVRLARRLDQTAAQVPVRIRCRNRVAVEAEAEVEAGVQVVAAIWEEA